MKSRTWKDSQNMQWRIFHLKKDDARLTIMEDAPEDNVKLTEILDYFVKIA